MSLPTTSLRIDATNAAVKKIYERAQLEAANGIADFKMKVDEFTLTGDLKEELHKMGICCVCVPACPFDEASYRVWFL